MPAGLEVSRVWGTTMKGRHTREVMPVPFLVTPEKCLDCCKCGGGHWRGWDLIQVVINSAGGCLGKRP